MEQAEDRIVVRIPCEVAIEAMHWLYAREGDPDQLPGYRNALDQIRNEHFPGRKYAVSFPLDRKAIAMEFKLTFGGQ